MRGVALVRMVAWKEVRGAADDAEEPLHRSIKFAACRFRSALAQVLDLPIRFPNRDRGTGVCQGQNDLALIFAREYEIH